MPDFLGVDIRLWLVVGLPVLLVCGWRVVVALQTAQDARAHGWSRRSSAGWALSALILSRWYWQEGRLARLTQLETQRRLESRAQAHRLADVRNIRCPVCDAELANVLTVLDSGGLGVRPAAQCPQCDFRLDACRHCQHFLPANDGFGGQKDFTTGRCGLYRAPQLVQNAFPHMAKQLEAMGYETLNAPQVIVDSFVPLEECTGFTLDHQRLRLSRIPWLNRERAALIELQRKQFDRAGDNRASRK